MWRAGVRDESGIRSGDDFSKDILQNLEGCRLFVIIVTNAAMNSPWVRVEAYIAQIYGKRFFPLSPTTTPPPEVLISQLAAASIASIDQENRLSTRGKAAKAKDLILIGDSRFEAHRK